MNIDVNLILPSVNPNQYLINIDGQVISLPKTIKDSLGRTRTTKQKIMSCPTNKKGYKQVTFKTSGKPITIELHRLIALAFIPNPNSYKAVNHRNGNKLDNSLNNLEWISFSANNSHAWRTGLRDNCKGKDHHSSTVSDEVISYALIKLEDGFSQQQIADEIGVNRATISKWKNKKWRTCQ